MTESTLAIIKPDACSKGFSGLIIDRIIKEGFNITGIKTLKFSIEQAYEFYKVHKGKYFYEKLCSFISSSKVFVLVLERKNAVSKWREIMGSTNSCEAEKNTLRNLYGDKNVITRNAVHGSDSNEAAELEIKFFFNSDDLTK